MSVHRNKSRANLTIDPDIYRDAQRVFKLLDMNMSGFFEQQLAVFLQTLAPLRPIMEQVELGKVDPAELKAAMRAFSASATGQVVEQLAEFQRRAREVEQIEVSTDKK